MSRNRLDKLNRELKTNDNTVVPDTEKIMEYVFKKAGMAVKDKDTLQKGRAKRIILAAAILACAVTFTAIAASFGWHEKLIEYFNHPTQEQMTLMDRAFDAPCISGTDNGYTANVINTLADDHGLYVLYELILPENKALSREQAQEYMSEIYHRVLVDPITDENDGGLVSMGIGRNVIMEADGNKMVVCEYIGFAKGVSDECKVGLIVGDSYNTDPHTTEGNFHIELSWNYRYEKVGRTIEVKSPLKVNSVNDNVLSRIDISPISVWVVVEGDDILTGIRPKILFSDGTVLEYDSKDRKSIAMFSSYRDERNPQGISTLGYVFEEITDIDSIVSITVGDCIVGLR